MVDRGEANPPDFRALFENAPSPYLVLDRDLIIVAVDDAYAKATMRSREGLLGLHLFEAFPDNPDDPGADGVRNLRGSLERALKFGRPDPMALQRYDIPRPEDQGGGFEQRYWSPLNIPVPDAHGRLAWIIHRVEDVTAEVRLEAEGAALVKLANDQQHVIDQLRSTNRELAEQICERKRIEKQLLQAQKMEAIGNLTGGLAHDFNNLLGVIVGNLELLRGDLPAAGTPLELLNDSLHAAWRGAELAHRLLAFARRQPLNPEPTRINDLIEGINALLSRTLGENILISLDLGPGIWPVAIDPVQLEAALLHLATNARDAMPRGGRLLIATRNWPSNTDRDGAAERFVSERIAVEAQMPEELPRGDHVVIEVSDTGAGIADTALPHIFEPFFTTKETGRGTGLGLSMVFGFVKQSGGHVAVSTAPGDGTTFRLYLPRLIDTPSYVPAAQAARPGTGGGETILLVEDNEAMRRTVSRLLGKLGYKVLEAASAAAALDLMGSSPIDLLLSDVVMPGEFDGIALARQVTLRFPRVKIVLMSGFPGDGIDGSDGIPQNVLWLRKPYPKEDLAATLLKAFGR